MLRIIIAACLVPLAVFAADLELAGGLERVTQESIRIAKGDRIAANLPKTADLSSERISAQFHLADEIQITCKPKDQGQCADLRSIRFLRPPTARERFLLGSPTPPASPGPELERIRQVNLEHAKNMPSFIASETAKRYTSSRAADPPVWKLVDIVDPISSSRATSQPANTFESMGRSGTSPSFPASAGAHFWLGN